MQSVDEKVLEKSYQLNLDKFDDLLDFDNDIKNKKVNITILEPKKECIDKKIDFSIFDKLLDDFKDNFDNNKLENIKYSIDLSNDDLIYLKDKIRYYESKIENTYNLNTIEKDEKYVVQLNNQLMIIKDMYIKIEKAFNNKEFNSKEELIDLINKCKMEINSLETVLNIDYRFSNIEVRIINDAINKQDRLINKLKIKIGHLDEEIKVKNSLIVLKKMIFNSFKMLVGIYLMHFNEDSFKKLMIGSLFILNSIIGMRKAINSELKDLKYHKYRDYDTKNINVVNEILLLALDDIINLQKELKDKFSCYKEYFHDYEEIYFSICNIKSIIEASCQKLKGELV